MSTIIAFIIGAAIGLLLSLPMLAAAITGYVLLGLAFAKLSEKKPIKNPWLIWIPYANSFYYPLALMQMSNTKTFRLFGGKLEFQNKMTAYWIYIGIMIGSIVISIPTMLITLIPFVGFIIALLGCFILFLAEVPLCFIQYVLMRDMLNAYRADEKANVTMAIWITVLNPLTFGLFGSIYLFRMRNAVPLGYMEDDNWDTASVQE